MSIIDFRFPFEYKTLAGYLIAMSIQFLLSLLTTRYLACFLTLAFGHFAFSLAFCKDMIHCLHVINKNGKAKKTNSEILKQFIDMDSELKMLRSLFVPSSLMLLVLIVHFQVTDRFFGHLPNNNSDPFFRQHHCHLYGSFAASNEFSLVDTITEKFVLLMSWISQNFRIPTNSIRYWCYNHYYMDFGHLSWWALHASWVKDNALPTTKLTANLVDSIGIGYRWKYSEWYRCWWSIHSNHTKLYASEAFYASVKLSKL